ncbi:Ig-like domain-containing protein, partial [Flavobacterium succinicans]|uniref:Ig-like domain-containing protein n=1 Tax=Flavobacterium succinicans TaxID=29536 RepID=UPI000AA1C85C
DIADVVIKVTAQNDAPIAIDYTNAVLTASAGSTTIKSLQATDSDGIIVNYTIVSLPRNGVLALAGIPVVPNQVLTPLEANGLTYDPSGAFSGNDTFLFSATDDKGALAIAPATITIPVINEVIASNDGIHLINNVTGKTIDSVLMNDVLNGIVLTPTTYDLVSLTPINVPTGFTFNKDGSVDVKAGTPAGKYTLVYEICTKNAPMVCAQATVTVTVTCNTTKISGVVKDVLNNKPLANVPVTLIPDKKTTGSVLLMLTKADGSYSFTGFTPGDYIIQVQDVNLNSSQNLYNVGPSIQFLNIQSCNYEVVNFDYDKTDLPVLGNFVWYDINSNGLQDEWFDANNDGLVTQNLPDANGYIDYSKWEWIDYNGDGSYQGKINEGEINAAGLGNGTTNVPNVYITGPNGFSRQVTMSIQGYWRTRAPQGNWGDYQVNLVMESNLETAAQAKVATGLIKNLSSPLNRFITKKNDATQGFVVCGVTNNSTRNTQLSATNPIDYKLDFGIQCKLFATMVANNDSVGAIVSSTSITPKVKNVLANDTFNGKPVVLADVNLTVVNTSPNLRLNPDGSVDVLANTPAGTYILTYQICEKNNPSNCQTATETITVVAPVILAINDDYTSKPIDASKGVILDILGNDKINNGTVSPSQVTITILDTNGLAGITVDAQGKIVIPAGVPIG